MRVWVEIEQKDALFIVENGVHEDKNFRNRLILVSCFERFVGVLADVKGRALARKHPLRHFAKNPIEYRFLGRGVVKQ